MKRLIAISFLTLASGSLAPGQPSAVPANWLSTWILNLKESKIGPIRGPGIPASGLTVTSQTLTIAVAAGHLKVAGDTVTTQIGNTHEAFDVDLERGETILSGGPRVSFTKIDDTAFDIVLSLNNKTFGNQAGVNRFVFSADGKTLTESKTQTEREPVPEGEDQTKGAVTRTSTSILVFHRPAEQFP
jgi:hypothetical protein